MSQQEAPSDDGFRVLARTADGAILALQAYPLKPSRSRLLRPWQLLATHYPRTSRNRGQRRQIGRKRMLAVSAKGGIAMRTHTGGIELTNIDDLSEHPPRPFDPRSTPVLRELWCADVSCVSSGQSDGRGSGRGVVSSSGSERRETSFRSACNHEFISTDTAHSRPDTLVTKRRAMSQRSARGGHREDASAPGRQVKAKAAVLHTTRSVAVRGMELSRLQSYWIVHGIIYSLHHVLVITSHFREVFGRVAVHCLGSAPSPALQRVGIQQARCAILTTLTLVAI